MSYAINGREFGRTCELVLPFSIEVYITVCIGNTSEKLNRNVRAIGGRLDLSTLQI